MSNTYISLFSGSRIPEKIVVYFANNPRAEIGCRELCREVGEDSGNLYRHMHNLSDAGYLIFTDNKRYSLNKDFPFLAEFHKIVKVMRS